MSNNLFFAWMTIVAVGLAIAVMLMGIFEGSVFWALTAIVCLGVMVVMIFWERGRRLKIGN